MNTGDLIRKLRGSCTQVEFAELMGVGQRTVSAWEIGQNHMKSVPLARLLRLFPDRQEEILDVITNEGGNGFESQV